MTENWNAPHGAVGTKSQAFFMERDEKRFYTFKMENDLYVCRFPLTKIAKAAIVSLSATAVFLT